MIIRLALGTSTPTSITVVATSSCRRAALNSSITAAFSAGFMRPWIRPTRSSPSAAESSSNVVCAAWQVSSSDSSISVHTQ
ncbi:hypothetical protein D3C80_2100490 [compost metagenome]